MRKRIKLEKKTFALLLVTPAPIISFAGRKNRGKEQVKKWAEIDIQK